MIVGVDVEFDQGEQGLVHCSHGCREIGHNWRLRVRLKESAGHFPQSDWLLSLREWVVIFGDLSRLRVRAEIDERFVKDLRVGQGGRYTGVTCSAKRILDAKRGRGPFCLLLLGMPAGFRGTP
jgi:hypothetical protein